MSTLTQFFGGAGGGGDNTTKLTLTANENITAGDAVVLRSDGKIEKTNKTQPNLSSEWVSVTDVPSGSYRSIASKTNGTVTVATNSDQTLTTARLLITLTSPTNPQYPENAPNPLSTLVSFPTTVQSNLGDVNSGLASNVVLQSIQYMSSQDVFVAIGYYIQTSSLEKKGWAIAFTVNESTGAVTFGSASKVGQGHSYANYDETPFYMYEHPTLSTQMYYNQVIYDVSANTYALGVSRFTVSGTTITRVVDFDTAGTYTTSVIVLSPLAIKSNRALFAAQIAGSFDDFVTATCSINSSTGDIATDLGINNRAALVGSVTDVMGVGYNSTYDVFIVLGKAGTSYSALLRILISGSNGVTNNLTNTVSMIVTSITFDDVTQKLYVAQTTSNVIEEYAATSASTFSRTTLPIPFDDDARIDANNSLIFYMYDDGALQQIRQADINAVSNWTQYIGIAEEDITSGNSGVIVFNGGIASIPTQAEGTKVTLYTSYDGTVSTVATGATVGSRAGKDFVITNVY